MSEVKYGCLLPLEICDFEQLVQIVEDCEKLGYDSVWAYDHLSPYWVQSAQAFECWTTLSALAERTKKIRLGTLVTNANFRNPALLAKMTTALDIISNGRLIVGLGTGDQMSRNEVLSFGIRFANIEERVTRLRENVQILKSMWTQDETIFSGKYTELSNAINWPKPKLREV